MSLYIHAGGGGGALSYGGVLYTTGYFACSCGGDFLGKMSFLHAVVFVFFHELLQQFRVGFLQQIVIFVDVGPQRIVRYLLVELLVHGERSLKHVLVDEACED